MGGLRREIRLVDCTCEQVQGAIRKHIVREAGHVRLINIQHIDTIVEGPRVQGRAISVRIGNAWATFQCGSIERGLARTTAEIDR